MFTIEDIRNPARKSGFRHVDRTDGPPRRPRYFFQASGGSKRDEQGRALNRPDWKAPKRTTAEEAALDYCDVMNGDPIPMTRTRRTQAELDAFRATLTKVTCSCGHHAVMARDYYDGSIAPGTQGKWELCVECYRELEKVRQRSYRTGSSVGLKRVQRDNFVAKDRAERKPKSEEILRLEAELRAAREAHYESEPTDCYLVAEKVTIPQDAYYVKIGYAGDETLRVKSLQTGNPRDLLVLALLDGTEKRDGKEIERDLHARHIECNHCNEWFEATPAILASFGLTWADFLTMIEKTDERAPATA